MQIANGARVQELLLHTDRKLFGFGFWSRWWLFDSGAEREAKSVLRPLLRELGRNDRLNADGSITLPDVFIEAVVGHLAVIRTMAVRAAYRTMRRILQKRRGAPGSWCGADDDSNPSDINQAFLFLENIAATHMRLLLEDPAEAIV